MGRQSGRMPVISFLLDRLFGKPAGPEAVPAHPTTLTNDPAISSLPTTGSVYSFRTSPLSEFAPLETGRYAAFKILAANQTQIVVAVLDGIWSTPPSLAVARKALIVREHRFAWTGRLAVFGFWVAWWVPDALTELRLLGRSRISGAEAKLGQANLDFAVGTWTSTLHAADRCAEGEWRWSHDREALISEQAKVDARNAEIRAAKEERYRSRLSKLTWNQLLAETPFKRWSASPPFPPPDFTNSARKIIHEACEELAALGPKPRKAAVRAVLKRCVIWFNDADAVAGGVIETEEREDICAVLEEMAFVAKHKALVEEVDGWRDW